MIAELLDKSFVVESMQWVKESIGKEAALLETNDPEAKARSDEAGTSQKDLESAEERVEEALAKEAGSLAGAPDKDEPFFPRNPGTALLQSSLHAFFEERNLVHEPQGHGLEPGEVAVTMRSLRPGALMGTNQRLFEPFEQTDAGWVSCKIAEAFTKFRGRHKFPETPARLQIANNARIVLVADWTTAIPRAQLIGTRMRDQLLKAKDRERHVIHLGDVYYSGWKGEYQNQFLSHWPVINDTEGGNHDMFSGGHDA